jgi:5-methylcytosine-specific restriction endonuclease McrA
MTLRPCLDCGRPAEGNRCNIHRRARQPTGDWARRAGEERLYAILKAEALERDHYTCVYCGKTAVVADHVIPRALGGQTTLENLVAACWHCNSVRGGTVRRE